jgi:hypothetical protein
MTGPSLDLMGESIELLRYEGLVVHEAGAGEPLAITQRGREVLLELLRANVRAGSGAMNDLVFALKMRFLHLLERDEQVQQVGLMIEACETELARIEDVTVDESGHLAGWLAIDKERLAQRIDYLRNVLADADELVTPRLDRGVHLRK